MTICDETQYAVAVEASLTAAARSHIAGCPTCGAVFEEYLQLTALVRQCGPPVPEGFVDRVMANIETAPRPVTQNDPPSFLERILDTAPMRYVAWGLGGALSAASLGRFVFYVLVPS